MIGKTQASILMRSALIVAVTLAFILLPGIKPWDDYSAAESRPDAREPLPVQAIRAVIASSASQQDLARPSTTCNLRRDKGIPSFVSSAYQTGQRVALYYDPTNADYGCGTSPYPFKVMSVSVGLADSPPGFVANWPVSVRLSIYKADTLINGRPIPGQELCFVVVNSMADHWPVINPVQFPQLCCVNKPFFVVLEYTGQSPRPFPSVLMDYYDSVPYGHAYVYRPDIQWWMDWHDQWLQPWPGFPYLWVEGETASTDCADTDGDGIPDVVDNCPTVPNPTQANNDADSQGDACDPDDDNDGVPDVSDNCQFIANPGQENNDGDALGDACDSDDDDDGIPDLSDNCPFKANPGQQDADGDGIGDSCDVCTDLDGDGFGNPGYPANTCQIDNCPAIANPDQVDTDGDGLGNSCDPDDDNDGIPDASDNCPQAYNPGQENFDGDAMGDACDPDDDNDGVPDTQDNCHFVANPNQANADQDQFGDACDPCPNDPYNDRDNDGLCADVDNCPNMYNPGQEDANQNSIGDVCECACPGLSDWNVDGMINPVDVVLIVNYVYKVWGAPPAPISGCPALNGDWSCDGIINPIDVVLSVNRVYKGWGGPPCDPCEH